MTWVSSSQPGCTLFIGPSARTRRPLGWVVTVEGSHKHHKNTTMKIFAATSNPDPPTTHLYGVHGDDLWRVGTAKTAFEAPSQVASPERAAPQPVRRLHHVCSERRGDLSIRTVKAHLLVLHILHVAHHPRAPWPLPVVCASLKGRGPLRSADPPVACNGRVVGQSRLNYRRLIPAATRNGA